MCLKEYTVKEMAYLLTWVVGTVLLAHRLESCETGWILYERFHVCYKLFTSPELNWSNARNFCKHQNAKLTDLYDHEEQTFIKNFSKKMVSLNCRFANTGEAVRTASALTVKQLTLPAFFLHTVIQKMKGHGVWIGAADLQDYDDWRWVDNSEMDIDKFQWWKGNPNNGDVPEFLDHFLPGEDCVEISLRDRHRGQLNDYDCERKMPFLCKKTAITTTTLALRTTHTLTSHPSSDADDKSIAPLVAAVVSLSLIAMVVIGLAVLLWRKHREGLRRNIYEDVSPTPNENIYTCLQTSEQLQHERNGACPTVNNNIPDDASFHEYHSVCFPNFELRSVSAKSKKSTRGESKTVRNIKQHSVKKY